MSGGSEGVLKWMGLWSGGSGVWSEEVEGDQMERGQGQVKAVVRWIAGCGQMAQGRW